MKSPILTRARARLSLSLTPDKLEIASIGSIDLLRSNENIKYSEFSKEKVAEILESAYKKMARRVSAGRRID